MTAPLQSGLLIAVAVFITVMSFLVLILLLLGVGRSPVDQRVESLGQQRPGRKAKAHDRRQALQKVRSKEESTQYLTKRIIQAGLYKKGSIALYSVIRIGSMLLPFAAGILAGQLGVVPMSLGLIYGTAAGVVGTVAPSLWLDYRKARRQTEIRRALPDALDVIVTCVDAGLSLPAAISRVSRELRAVHPLLAVEMAICQREIQLGASSGDALRKFSDRFDLEELRSLASVIQQAEKYGASITNALRVHAETLREKRFQMAEELAQKASVKMVFPTILCIFPALMIVLAGPAVLRIYQMFDVMGQ